MSELDRAIRAALSFDDSVIVERFVAGAEVNVGILNGKVLGRHRNCATQGACTATRPSTRPA